METFVIVFVGIGVISTVIMLGVAITSLILWRPKNKRWHSASNPPDSSRDVAIIVDGTERRAWRGPFAWFMYPPDSREVFDCIECHPTKWRELKDGE
jgi:hypothetical protein